MSVGNGVVSNRGSEDGGRSRLLGVSLSGCSTVEETEATVRLRSLTVLFSKLTSSNSLLMQVL